MVAMVADEALSCLPPDVSQVDFRNDRGEPEEEFRTFVALPNGDEEAAGKLATVWSQPMTPTWLALGGIAAVIPIDKK